MPGAGTRTDTTTARITARCLDLTRLVSRQGRGPLTGIDKVEIAYLRRLIDEPEPLFLLVRTALGYILLDNSGAVDVLQKIERKMPWGPIDLIGRIRRNGTVERRRAEADLRRGALARCRKGRLKAMVRSRLPRGTAYLNVGHSNLTDEVLGGWHTAVGGQVSVMVHDTIPLDYPQFQRPGTPEAFRNKLRRVAEHADLVIYNSNVTRADAERWFSGWGNQPKGTVAHLGVEVPGPALTELPPAIDRARTYFVSLGTIEPRKNHAFLLDIWESLAKELADDAMPVLVIAGSRGWANETLLQRLDRSPLKGRSILEISDLDDQAVAALIAGSAGLLFPSLAEGFGLPPIEAAALGVPVVCNELPVFREVLGNIPVYADSGNVYLWRQIITELAEKRQAGHARNGANFPATGIPTWTGHFNLVLKVT